MTSSLMSLVNEQRETGEHQLKLKKFLLHQHTNATLHLTLTNSSYMYDVQVNLKNKLYATWTPVLISPFLVSPARSNVGA